MPNNNLIITETIKIVGLGGQGVVTTAALLARAAFHQGWWSQSMPFFGVERTGTPVEAYIRLAHKPIHTHQPIEHPNILLINDHNLYNPQKLGRKLTIVNNPNVNLYQLKPTLLIYDSQQVSSFIFNKNLAIGLLGALSACWPLIEEKNWLKAIEEQFINQEVVQKNWQVFIANYELATKLINKTHD
jgi:pyruvate ferredoxin oxidoreductase gamma subunit